MDDGESPAPRLPLGSRERLAITTLRVAVVVLIGADAASDSRAHGLTLLCVIAGFVPVLALQQLARQAAARLVGWRLAQITFGFGREWWCFELERIRISVRGLPIAARVAPAARSPAWARSKRSAIHLAGPLCGALILVACSALLGARFSASEASFARVAVTSLALASGICTLLALVPYRGCGGPSDGFVLVSTWLGGKRRTLRQLSSTQLDAIHRLLSAERPSEALARAEQCAERFDDPRFAGWVGVCLVARGRADEGFARLEALGPPDERPTLERASLLGAAAWAVLFARDAALMPDAERAARRALQLEPGDGLFELLLGRTCLEQGRSEVAYMHLMNAYKRTHELDRESQCVAYLALAAHALAARGQSEMAPLAARFAAAALRHIMPSELATRLLAAFGEL